MRAIGIERVESFPFPTVPPLASLKAAVSLLTYLGAMHSVSQKKKKQVSKDRQTGSSLAMLRKLNERMSRSGDVSQQEVRVEDGGLTELGRLLVRFPINPRFSKMLILAHRADMQSSGSQPPLSFPLLAHTLTLVSALTEPQLFTRGDNNSTAEGQEDGSGSEDEDSEDGEEAAEQRRRAEEERRQRERRLLFHPDGDALARLHAVGAFFFVRQRYASSSSVAAAAEGMKEALQGLCSSQRLHLPALLKVAELRSQLQRICHSVLLSPSDSLSSASLLDPPSNPPSKQQETALRQVDLI